MKKTLFLIVLLLAVFAIAAQATVKPNPSNVSGGWTVPQDTVQPLTWCLYWYSGPNAGQRAYVQNIGIVYELNGWLLGSGGHTHDTSLSSGRKTVKIASGLNGVLPTQTWAESYTDSTGCAGFRIYTPVFAGWFYTDAKIDPTTCVGVNPDLGCISTVQPWYVNVAGKTFIGGPFIQQSAYNAGFYPAEWQADNQHAYPGTNFLSTDFPMYQIGTLYAALGGKAFPLVRGSLPSGGWVDGYLVGGFLWSIANSDRHQYGFSVDVISPSTAADKAKFVQAVHGYCTDISTGGVAIYMQSTHVSPTYAQFTDSTPYIWHIYCPVGYQPPVWDN